MRHSATRKRVECKNIKYRHKLETCCNGGGLDGIISRSSCCCSESCRSWRWWWSWWWLIPLSASGGDGDRCIESWSENSTSWSSFRHSHSPSTDTRKLHRYIVSWAPAMSSSSMTPPWCTPPWSPGGRSFRPVRDSCRIEDDSSIVSLAQSIPEIIPIIFRSQILHTCLRYQYFFDYRSS